MDLFLENGLAGRPRQKSLCIVMFLVKRPSPDALDVDCFIQKYLFSVMSCDISPSYCVGVKSGGIAWESLCVCLMSCSCFDVLFCVFWVGCDDGS